jgi:hypothetical protein
MANVTTVLRDALKTTEALLAKVQRVVTDVAEKELKTSLKKVVQSKKSTIKNIDRIVKALEKAALSAKSASKKKASAKKKTARKPARGKKS